MRTVDGEIWGPHVNRAVVDGALQHVQRRWVLVGWVPDGGCEWEKGERLSGVCAESNCQSVCLPRAS